MLYQLLDFSTFCSLPNNVRRFYFFALIAIYFHVQMYLMLELESRSVRELCWVKSS